MRQLITFFVLAGLNLNDSLAAESAFPAANVQRPCESFLRPMHFHIVRPGTVMSRNFDLGAEEPFEEEFPVTVNKAFEMMDTPVTREQYAYVMGKVRPEQPLHPIAGISWALILEFIQRLNKLSQSGDSNLTGLIEGHRDGDIYRLPTEAEWISVSVRAYRETLASGHPSGLHDIAWVLGNSSCETRDVAAKEPLYLDGQSFYDLLGHVDELVQDPFREDLRVYSTDGGGAFQTARGGSVRIAGDVAKFLYFRSRVRHSVNPGPAQKWLGLRLVRSYRGGLPFIRH